ncbi:hypothetical protein EBX31_07295 [bacterium]|nr:hypothetical protein [bacterium]
MTSGSTSFYYADGETAQGPFSAAHILSLKSLGKISDETYVIQAGGTEWTTFASLQQTLKSLLPGPARTEPPAPPPVAATSTTPVKNESTPDKTQPSPAKDGAPSPDASFTEQMLALSKSLDTPEQRHKRLAGLLGDIHELEEELVIRVVKNALAHGYRGSLHLSGLSSISQELADLLAQYPSRLSLSGLEDLTEDAAKALSKHRHTLNLTGLKELKPEIASILSKRNPADPEVTLLLDPFEITTETAQALATGTERIEVGAMETISYEALSALTGRKGPVSFDGFEHLSPQALEIFKSGKHPHLTVIGLEDIEVRQ